MRKTFVLVIALLAACAANPEQVQTVADAESARLQPPTKPLSSFAEYELKPMVFIKAIEEEKGKLEEAQEFERNLIEKISPLLESWRAASAVVAPVGAAVAPTGAAAAQAGSCFPPCRSGYTCDPTSDSCVLISEGRTGAAAAQAGSCFPPCRSGYTCDPTSDSCVLISEGRSGSLSIETEVMGLRIISRSARVWGGALSGDSFIDMDLRLIDTATGDRIADVRIKRNSGAMGGAWSMGKSDQNLDEYIVTIIYEYLTDNY